MFPGEATEQDGDVFAVLGFEGALYGFFEVLNLDKASFAAKTRIFGFDDGFCVCVQDSRAGAVFHQIPPDSILG